MKVSIITLGCRVNQAESEELEAVLKARGANIVDLQQNPDFCVVNTCTVTAESDQNSRQLIRRAARRGAKVIVTGCYSQLRKSEVSSLTGVVGIYDNARKGEIADFISPGDGRTDGAVTSSRCRPYIKVQDGCNFRCSYCAVHLARGRSRSVSPEGVVKRAASLEKAGFREIVLTGIHLGTYGNDLPERTGLSALVTSVLKATRTCRLRLSSLEVNEIDGALISLFDTGRVCDHLHIPLQSGSDRILGLMRRNYSSSLFRDSAERIIRQVPLIAIGTDVIVGFPGETESDFQDTLAFIGGLPFAYLHVFPYSRRPDTEASDMPGQVPVPVVRERMTMMRELAGVKRMEYMSRQIGRALDVIVERRAADWVMGTSANFLKIRVADAGLSPGTLVSVRPAAIREGALDSVLIQAQ